MKIYALLFCTLIIQTFLYAGEKAPLVTGTINISVEDGTIDCELMLSDIPRKYNYLLLLNAGLNIRSIRNTENNYNYYYEREHSNVSYEAFGYYIPDNTGKGKHIPKGLKFSYTGKFPVIADTANASRQDWKGNIAFNGYSVRADGFQAAWYPIFYDMENDKKYDEVRYDVTINCKGCNTIYLNGNTPVPGNTARLKSDIPVEMMLYAGHYNVKNIDGTFFLNPDITEEQMKNFGTTTNKFKKYYEEKTGIPYKMNIVYVNTTPVSKDNAWMFVSYPTIVNIGWGEYGMKGFFIEDEMEIKQELIAHELAHYYFGTYRSFNSPVADMITEGFAEYMSSYIVRHFYGEDAYKKQVNEWIEETKDFTPVCFSKLESDKKYGSRQKYVYNYVPLMLTAIEREIGLQAMEQWMKNILKGDAEVTDYKFLERTLSLAINDHTKLKAVKDNYLASDRSMENAVAALQK